MQAAARFCSGGGLPTANSTISGCDLARPPRSEGDRSDRLSVYRGASDQLGKQRYRAADTRRIATHHGRTTQSPMPCVTALLVSLAAWELAANDGLDALVWDSQSCCSPQSHCNSRRTDASPWHLSDESTRAYLGLAAGRSTSSLTAELAHNSGLMGLCCFGLRALSLSRVETHALSGNWDRVPSARSAVPRTGNSCCGRRSRLWVRNQFQPPRTTTNEDRDR